MALPSEGSEDKIELTGTDEWLLQAIRAASGPQGATLSDVIASADALNHAIFTPAELRSGFAKLLAARYIVERDGRWFINEVDRNPNVVGNSRKVTDPEEGEPGWSYPFSDEVIQGAISAYLKQQPTPALPRLHVDFNEMFEDGTVDLRGCTEELAKLGVPLREGLEVILWDEDVEMEGFLKNDPRHGMWVAVPCKLGFPLHVVIDVEGDGIKLSIHWDQFDGDDGFGRHWIQVSSPEGRQRFDYDRAVVYGLRKTTKFLESAGPTSGSQVLDSESFVLERTSNAINLTVRSEGRLLEWTLRNPRIIIDRTFMNLYDGDR